MWNRLFGGKKEDKPVTPPPPPRQAGGGAARGNGVTDGMEKIDQTLELLEKREAVLDKKINEEIEKAKKFMAKKNQNAAMQCMKRKKVYQEQILKIQAQRNNMETMKFTMQEQAMNVEVIQAQRAAAGQMRAMNRGMDAERVEDEREQLQEQMDEARNVTDVLTQPLDMDPVDDDELLDELNELTADEPPVQVRQQNTVQPTAAEVLPDLGPSVPSKPIAPQPARVEVDDDEAALAELEAELNA